MNVFLLQDASIIGGVENTTKNIVSMMNEDEKKNKIYSIFNKNKEQSSNEIIYLFKTKKFHYIKYILAFFYLKKAGATTIVTSYFIFNILNVLFSFFLKHKAIVQEHSSFHYDSKLKLKLKLIAYKYSYCFMVINEYDRIKYASLSLNPVRIKNSIGEKNILDSIRNNSWDYEFNNYFLIASRIDHNKRIELAIEAYLLYKKNKGIKKLIICGDGCCFKALINKYSHYSDIIFLGMIQNVYPFISHAACLLITSKLECFPTSILEAKFLGVPTIAFSVPSGIPELIIDKVDGYLVLNNDIIDFANRMLELDDDFIYSKLSQNAKNTYEKNYSDKIVCNLYSRYIS
ncbi:glycosyltransferase [Providencia manganoxydans]|uniref:glycosyltransferase n=1 Tax=Providencia manganoxydans TaxID=2923283 RepID=UPI0032DB7C84